MATRQPKSNLRVVHNPQEKVAADKQIVKTIKPKLEKFLIDQQVNKAAETAVKSHQQAVDTLTEMTRTQADVQASKIAMRAFLDLKLWEKFPPPLEYSWLTGVSSADGHRLTFAQLKSEFAHDISGFSAYLIREWQHMKKDIAQGKYPNPLSWDEAATVFFWQKFCADMTLLVKADRRYQALGNKGLLLPDQH